ncbi:cupin domain-containing protein [Shewanella sp. 202IG2-18]|uniref:cupin domain-containing protein n=1 Tax=Parashewanella hymeniacidonis TaxID=2807618 RepID=UPI0019601B0D|nr:cupin domain-containing protein [Parashewanella hymeniacidonis]MBM7071431.1 cupin domain-containing protein [Parashewanella hymeniacidonis]
MQSKILDIKNYNVELQTNAADTTTDVIQSVMSEAGEYGFVVFKLDENRKQKPHFHTYGDIDIFMVVEGSGILHLAEVKDDQIVSGSNESLQLKQGDIYSVKPYFLHSIETKNEPIVIANIAPLAHSDLKEGRKNQIAVDLFFTKN